MTSPPIDFRVDFMTYNETTSPQTKDPLMTITPQSDSKPKPVIRTEDFGNGIFINWKI